MAAFVWVCLLPLTLRQEGPPRVDLKEVQTLGCEQCAGAEQLGRIQDISVSPYGDVYVANYYAPFIRVWSPDGTLRASFGRQGEGPGEFHSGVLDLFSTEDGKLLVLDSRQRRLSSFNAQGKLVGTMSLEGPYITAAAFSEVENAMYGAVRVGGSNGCRISQVRRWPIRGIGEATVVTELPDAPVPRLLNCPAVVYNMDTFPRGGFGVAFGYDDYVLLRFNAVGTLEYRAVRDVARVPRTKEELDAERRRIKRIAGDLLDAEPDPRRSHFTGDSLRFDSAGRAWIRTERGGEGETVFDIFAPGGSYMGEVVLPITVKSPGTGFELAGSYLLTISVDEDSGTEFLKLWRIDWSH